MKKVLALILSAAAVVCLFASCGKSDEDVTTASDASVSETVTDENGAAVTEAATDANGETAAATSANAATSASTIAAAATATASNPNVKYMNINSEAYTVTCKEGFDNYGFSCQVCDTTDTYAFKAGTSNATWTVYVLDKEFTDSIRMLPQAYSPKLTGNGTLKIKNGQYVYIQCSVNAFTAENYNNAYLEITRASDSTSAASTGIKTGNYGDETSQRATATVTKSGDKYIINVRWSSSNAEGYEWTMTGTLNGNKLSYTDCKKTSYTYTDANNDTPATTTLYTNGTGYFTVTNGKLAWNGAAETECQSCVFAQ